MARRIVALLALACAAPAAAQRDNGSFPLTFAGATLGSAAGFAAGILLAPRSQGSCDLSVGGGCTEVIGAKAIPFILATTVVGSTGGAWLGRRLSDGRQELGGTVAGALFGAVVGTMIIAEAQGDDAALITIAMSVPTGLLATLLGWDPPRR